MPRHAPSLALGVLVLLTLPFSIYAARFGWQGMTQDLSAQTYLYVAGALPANGALSLHMALGALLTLAVPLQLVTPLRRRAPGVHRWTGRVLTLGAMLTGVAGLTFIALRGTVGGWPMDAGFTLYGLLIVLAGGATLAAARRRDIARHRRWALRLFVLILGSWAFRAMYVVWFLATGGLGSTEALTGPFDRVMVFAFYLPWLALLELYLRPPYRRAPWTG